MTLEPHEDFELINDVKYYHRLTQGSDEWDELRRGMLTASTMKQLVTAKTLKTANNNDTKAIMYELASQRITGKSPDHFVSYAMERGNLEEVEARIEYSKQYEPVKECGFVINESLGFPIGMSPDGLVGHNGGIENKSRLAKFQVQTIVEYVNTDDQPETPIPPEFMLQVQCSLFVSKRDWWDFTSYSNGLNMVAIRCFPIAEYQDAIKAASIAAEAKIVEIVDKYNAALADENSRISPVKYIDHSEEQSI